MKPGKIKIFGASDCYGLSDKIAFTLRLSIEMTDPVDGTIFKHAVEKLEKRFSYLKLSLNKDISEFYYLRNDRPWVVWNTDKPIDLNAEENNFHLQAFSYYGNWIYINAYHGQLDGTGLFMLMKSLLYYYCCEKYGTLKISDVALADEEADPEEYYDAYLEFYRRMRQLPSEELKKLKKNAKPFKQKYDIMRLQKMGIVRGFDKYSFRIQLDQKDMMEYCSSFDGSPVSAIGLMLAEGIKKVHEGSDKDIVIGIPVNLRPYMGFKKTHSNTYAKVYLPYTNKIREKDFETQGTIFRGLILRRTESNLLKLETYKYCRQLRLLNYLPLTCAKQLAAGIVAKQMMNGETADVTYVGKCEFGEMDQYINALYSDVDATGLGFQLIISAFGDKFFLSIDQDWKNREYTVSFLNELKSRGIPYKIVYEGNLSLPKIRNIR